jgi:hypothetical protein
MELNLSELTLTEFNRIHCSKQLVWHGHLTVLNLSNFKMIKAMGLKINASRSH